MLLLDEIDASQPSTGEACPVANMQPCSKEPAVSVPAFARIHVPAALQDEWCKDLKLLYLHQGVHLRNVVHQCRRWRGVRMVSQAAEKSSTEKFKELGVCEELAEAAVSLGWKTPSSIQQQAIPHLLQGRCHGTPPAVGTHALSWQHPPPLAHARRRIWCNTFCRSNISDTSLAVTAGRDVIGLAQTGSGKTGAFALPILQELLDKPQALFALALSPTRELAIQIAEQFEALGAGIQVKCAVLVGGIDMMAQVSDTHRTCTQPQSLRLNHICIIVSGCLAACLAHFRWRRWRLVYAHR